MDDDAGHVEGLDDELDSDESDGEAPAHWRDFAVLLSGHRRQLLIMGGVLAVSSTLPLIGPLLVRAFVDRAIAGAPTERARSAGDRVRRPRCDAAAAHVGVVCVSTALVWRVTNDVRVALAEHVFGSIRAFISGTPPVHWPSGSTVT